jgi:glycosyltransferase involved in cell wall biosynthesis
MQQAAAIGPALQPLADLRVLALLEAVRVTGVARNVIEYARLAAAGAGGVTVAMTLALIRRGRQACGTDILRDQVAAAGLSSDILTERHRYDQLLVAQIRRAIAAHDPDIIETHHIKSHCLVALSGAWRTRPWVAFHHGYTQTDAKVRAYNHVDRWSLRHAAHVVTTNEYFAAMLAERGVPPGRITVLHNGVRRPCADPAAVALLRRSLGLGATERVVLAVGRLSREKGQAYLVRAAALWRRDARLVIVGDGMDRPKLEALARSAGVSDRVIFAGLSHDVAPFYGLADVFVLPSLSEGSPNALLEAMSCGLPIVATRVGGVPEIAANGLSALIGPAKDSVFLARSVDRLLANTWLGVRLGSAARKVATSRFTQEQRAVTLSRLYADLGLRGQRAQGLGLRAKVGLRAQGLGLRAQGPRLRDWLG